MTEPELKRKAEQEIRNVFETRVSEFVQEMRLATYENVDLTDWDFWTEFQEWLTYQ